MSKKLLKESTVRKFMKLANIGALSDTFVNEMEYNRDDDDAEETVEPVEEALFEEEEEDTLEAEVPVDAGAELEGDEVEGEGDDLGGDHEDLLRRVVQAVATELDVDVEIEGEEGAEEGEEALPLEDEEPAAELGGEEPVEEPEEGEEDLMSEAIEALLEKAGIEIVDDEAITESLIKKVSGRVARRLIKEYL